MIFIRNDNMNLGKDMSIEQTNSKTSYIYKEISIHHYFIYPSLVLVQPRKTRPYITERLLMGRKESNQTNKI